MPTPIIRNPKQGRIWAKKVEHGQAARAEYYIALFSNDFTPLDSTLGNTAFLTACGEITTYTGNRKLFVADAISSVPDATNTANPAEFTFTADGYIWGYMVMTSSTKGGEGQLITVVNYGEANPVTNGSVWRVVHTGSLVDGNP